MEISDVSKIFSAVVELYEKKTNNAIESMVKKHFTPEMKFESDLTGEINTALSKAQGEFPTIVFNRENPHLKEGYTDLNAIMKVIRPILSKHGLSFTQQLWINDGETLLISRCRHCSGQWIECRCRVISTSQDLQKFDSGLQKMKIIAAMSLLNITAANDPSDDDAEKAMTDVRTYMEKGTALDMKYVPVKESYETITKEQIEELEYELQEYSDIASQLFEMFKIDALCDIPKSKFQWCADRIRKLKLIRQEAKIR